MASARQALSASELCGLWVAHYASHGPEVVSVSLHGAAGGAGGGEAGGGGAGGEVACGGGGGGGDGDGEVGGGSFLEAIKVTGDAFVPAGQRTWLAHLEGGRGGGSRGVPTVARGSTLACEVHVADHGFNNPRTVRGAVEVRSAASLLLTMGEDDREREWRKVEEVAAEAVAAASSAGGGSAGGGGAGSDGTADEASSMLFTRCTDSALWFIDPFAEGKLLPPTTCKHFLSRAGLPDNAHYLYLTPIAPERVWARMARNISMFHRKERRSDEAGFWDNLGLGLEPEATTHEEAKRKAQVDRV